MGRGSLKRRNLSARRALHQTVDALLGFLLRWGALWRLQSIVCVHLTHALLIRPLLYFKWASSGFDRNQCALCAIEIINSSSAYHHWSRANCWPTTEKWPLEQIESFQWSWTINWQTPAASHGTRYRSLSLCLFSVPSVLIPLSSCGTSIGYVICAFSASVAHFWVDHRSGNHHRRQAPKANLPRTTNWSQSRKRQWRSITKRA